MYVVCVLYSLIIREWNLYALKFYSMWNFKPRLYLLLYVLAKE